MKEPDLEENALRAERDGANLSIVRRSVEPDDSPVTVTTPSGPKITVHLNPGIGGRHTVAFPATDTGIVRLEDGDQSPLAPVGHLTPLESSDVRHTATPAGGHGG